MIELRRDPISARWVIINDNRYSEYGGNDNIHILDQKLCPFCPGKENLTPPALLAYDKKGNKVSDKSWNIRVIPNNKPILAIEGSISRRAEG
ncbi:MAG: galactose-1-phosphate uridylyltransferase, partial [Endomicrobiia bacterium]